MSGRRRAQPKKYRPLVVDNFDDVPLTCGHVTTGLPAVDAPRRKWWCDTCRAFKSRRSSPKEAD